MKWWQKSLLAIGSVLLQELFGAGGKNKNSKQSAGLKTTRTNNQRADQRSRTSSRNAHGASSPSAEISPGQFGAGATRDLTAAEIRKLELSYAPNFDGDPDPGEVVWTWVPYVENDGRGKDRPVLIIGRLDNGAVAACYLTSTFHNGFTEIGTGDWDSKHRVSYLNPKRILRVTAAGMRRESVAVTKTQFDTAAAAIRKYTS